MTTSVRALGILAGDVLVFMMLIIFGAIIHQALPWPSFVVPFLFLPPFVYVVYREPGRRFGIDVRYILWMAVVAAVVMGILFGILRLPPNSWIARAVIIGTFSAINSYCFTRDPSQTVQSGT